MESADVGATYKVVRIFEVTANSHLPRAVAAVHIPLAPVEGVCRPRRKIAAVGGRALGLGEQGARASRLFGHARVCARPNVGQAQG